MGAAASTALTGPDASITGCGSCALTIQPSMLKTTNDFALELSCLFNARYISSLSTPFNHPMLSKLKSKAHVQGYELDHNDWLPRQALQHNVALDAWEKATSREQRLHSQQG